MFITKSLFIPLFIWMIFFFLFLVVKTFFLVFLIHQISIGDFLGWKFKISIKYQKHLRSWLICFVCFSGTSRELQLRVVHAAVERKGRKVSGWRKKAEWIPVHGTNRISRGKSSSMESLLSFYCHFFCYTNYRWSKRA